MTYTAYFDGSCGPVNPGGTVCYGAVVFLGEEQMWSCSMRWEPPSGVRTTNNIAEYLGLLAVLDFFIRYNLTASKIVVHGDSRLVIEQVFGTWKIKSRGRYYEKLAVAARDKAGLFRSLSGKWIPREENTLADTLSKPL